MWLLYAFEIMISVWSCVLCLLDMHSKHLLGSSMITLIEFNGMLWGQRINVYTNHKNLTQDGLGLTFDRVARWRILLEEYAPEIIYIKGIHNTVADAISQLDYDPKLPVDLLHYPKPFLESHLFQRPFLAESLDTVASDVCANGQQFLWSEQK